MRSTRGGVSLAQAGVQTPTCQVPCHLGQLQELRQLHGRLILQHHGIKNPHRVEGVKAEGCNGNARITLVRTQSHSRGFTTIKENH